MSRDLGRRYMVQTRRREEVLQKLVAEVKERLRQPGLGRLICFQDEREARERALAELAAEKK